ncbi:MAG: aminotransferase class I/II-fold pyridoxal phosphate-dependent enzyme [Acidobacteria bacterium]|nr:aminotransferase class I/II-fold pyridoxal phosphate-dependent enzyme [Acidobacteriota bacterium]MCB9398045.1 aminotransferase class I/II-fold pyridoxal phosphate-dependent enzyme [Acidobacteriota bacterium]
MKLDQNERSEGAPEWARTTLRELGDQAIWGYPKREPAEASIAAFWNLDPKQVLLGNGSDEVILYLFSSLKPGAPVLLPCPTFGFYKEQMALWPIDARILPATPDFDQDWDQVRTVLSQMRDGLLILVRPNNPTGYCQPEAELIALIQLAAKGGNTVLLDEAYGEFCGQTLIPKLDQFPNLLIIRTLSKAFGLAGFRLGYMLGAPDKMQPLRDRAMPFNVTTPGIALVQAAMSPAAQADTQNYVQQVVANRDRLFLKFQEWGVPVKASGANFLMMRFAPLKAEFVFQALAGLGVRIRRWSDPDWAGVLRLSIPADLRDLEEKLAQVFQPQLLCLDVDGCLIDTRPSFDAAILATVRQFGGSADEAAILALRRTSGFNDDHRLTQALLRNQGIDIEFAEIQLVFNQAYFGSAQTQGLVTLESPLIQTAFWARLRDQYQVALVTGRNRREMAYGLETLQAKDILVYCLDDVQKGKPDPEGILNAQSRCGTRQTWMVGDNIDDILAAKAAGAIPIGVGPNREALLAAGAAIVLEDINQLEALL